MYEFKNIRVVNGCWYIDAYVEKNGYSRVRYKNKRYLSHRLSYSQTKGPIPEGLVLDHLCRNRACVNPDHLEPVTRGENNRRGKRLITHCKLGHPYSGDNLYVSPKGSRMCRTCQAKKGREYETANHLKRMERQRERREETKKQLEEMRQK